MKTDIEIAREAKPKRIEEIASSIGISGEYLEHYGKFKGKVNLSINDEKLKDQDNGKLILVTAISPTPAGEGKTTTSVGLVDGLCHIGKKAMICLREPSLGPCFGMKGGAAGGGHAQVIPMADINLHFTGDFHAISAAHNLLSALVDNHIHWSNDLDIDPRRITWKRVVDMNDRSLREVTCGLGGTGNGIPRQSGFDITVASEIMAVFCLATDADDLKKRIGNIVIGYSRSNEPIRAKQLKADGALSVLLQDAFQPNLVQTLENNPAFIHGGPFANIAHGCNSVVATKTALKLADYVVTEAGFGADLGAEKFFDIKCRKSDLKPDAVVLVATTKALKMHGGVKKEDLASENVDAVIGGCKNLERHVKNIRKFGVPVIVGINDYVTDTENEHAAIIDFCKNMGVACKISSHWEKGGEGASDLAKEVAKLADSGTSEFKTLYDNEMSLWDKTEYIAQNIYGASEIIADKKVRNQFKKLEDDGFGNYPICMAKTQYSFSTDPLLMGAPSGHDVPIKEVRLSAGAEFIVVVCGDIMTMPGLPRIPAAENIDVDENGLIQGLF
ncbi:MAG: formate--tetrahydrofolate ligase [SAR86 cluster bacterium]|uniref:Formate--tetrahydrofolate ligase n=1 Tax=SAR86 cluster bacterium TaxID=2030880 RepID=A0A838Y5W4_9GAMM|nr:formate--tetrahydrofolate ligase [SAR86 cluster bacterium]